MATILKDVEHENFIRARKFSVDFDSEKIEKIWVKDDPFLTAWLNAYSMTIPDGESLIVRTTQHYIELIKDPNLKKDAAGLIGQETTHSRGHEKFIQLLKNKGYKFEGLFKFVNFINTKILEPSALPIVRLAFISGIERINELIAEITLNSGKLKTAPSSARLLYEWHFAEEIEHKSVAFDIFKNISGNRFILFYGVFMCYVINLLWLNVFTTSFLIQDKQFFRISTWKRAFNYFFRHEKFLIRVTSGCLEMFRKGFHPSQTNNGNLANNILQYRQITESILESIENGSGEKKTV